MSLAIFRIVPFPEVCARNWGNQLPFGSGLSPGLRVYH